MKVLFLIKSDKTPSSRIRIKDILPYLSENGIYPDLEVLPKSFFSRLKLFKKASAYDLVVLQKRLLNWLDFYELRKNSRILAFDFDDAIYLRNASPSNLSSDYFSFSRMRMFKRTVLNSDVIIAANKTLAEKVDETAPGKHVEIVPSTVAVDKILPKTDYSLSGPAVIGWIGSKSTLRYLDLIAPALKKASQKHDFVLRIVADDFKEIPGVKTDFVKWTLESQYSLISKFDIGLMPLSSDPFSEGKAAFKLIQYMACGVPSICSPVGMNLEVAGKNKNCLAAEDYDDFAGHIIRLLENESFRMEIGKKGREMVEKVYSNSEAGKKLASLFLSLKN
jgi:glycosyltransferase involved in cell wall biosynthesis